ncbi:MAG: hypothetical protein NW208_11345 [Bryobacter sp.]|nr:hypothetical protein [Bryobacter sp.]
MLRRTFLLAAPAILRAQTLGDRGRKLMEAAQLALGGTAFLGMRDRTEEGRAYSYYRERLSGLSLARFETFYDADAGQIVKVRERQAFGKKFDYAILFEGNGKAWDITFRGARAIPEETVERWQDSTLRNVFYILRCRMDEPGMIFERRSLEVVDNQPVEIVDITDSDNRTVSVYLHQSTKLPVRQVYRRQTPERYWNEEITTWSKYRETQGVQWPWAITRSRNGERNLELYSNDVVINKGLSKTDFQLGAKVNLIEKKK